MIQLTRLGGAGFVVNAELIKYVETVPDTLLTLRDGEKLMVCESVDEVVGRALASARATRFMPEANR